MPTEVGVSSPDVVIYSLLILDFMVLIGSFGYAFKVKFLNAKTWLFIAITYPIMLFAEAGFDFYAGGYTVDEMLIHSLLLLIVTGVFVAPLIMYLDDFKVSETTSNN